MGFCGSLFQRKNIETLAHRNFSVIYKVRSELFEFKLQFFVNNGSVKEILNLSSKDSKETGLKPLEKNNENENSRIFIFVLFGKRIEKLKESSFLRLGRKASDKDKTA